MSPGTERRGAVGRWRDEHAVLLCDGEPIAPLEIAASYRARSRGLLGRDGIEGAILLTPSNGVHTVRMCFPIEVAFLTKDLRVLSIVRMRANRIGMLRLRARHVLEAEWDRFAGWGVRPGARLGVGESRDFPGVAGRTG